MPHEVVHHEGDLHVVSFTPPAHAAPYTARVAVSLVDEGGEASSLVAAGEVRVRASPGTAVATTTAVVHAPLRTVHTAESPPPPVTAVAGAAAELFVRPRDANAVPTTTRNGGDELNAQWLTAEVFPSPLEAEDVTYDGQTGLFRAAFLATVAGDYVVVLRGGGEPLGPAIGVDDGSAAGATTVTVEAGPTSAARSLVLQLSTVAIAGTRWACTVVARDVYGNAVGYRPWLGGDAFAGALQKLAAGNETDNNVTAETLSLSTLDHGDGSYTLHGVPTVTGFWALNATLGSQPLAAVPVGWALAVAPAQPLPAACLLSLQPAHLSTTGAHLSTTRWSCTGPLTQRDVHARPSHRQQRLQLALG